MNKIISVILVMLLISTTILASYVVIAENEKKQLLEEKDTIITGLKMDKNILAMKLQYEIVKDSEYKSLWMNAEAEAEYYQNELRSNPLVVYVPHKVYVDRVQYVPRVPRLKPWHGNITWINITCPCPVPNPVPGN